MRSKQTSAGLIGVAVALLALVPLAARATDDMTVRVEYVPPYLSVSASDVSLGELLKRIGEKVGFTVAAEHAASAPVSVSIPQATVDDALRQLLRAENHTILYRQGAGSGAVVDRIVLLGAPAQGLSVVDLGPTPGREGSPAASGNPDPGTLPQTVASGTQGARATPESTSADGPPATVADMLKSQALAGAPPQATGSTPPAPASTPSNPEESLADATRRAQQALSQLVEGLGRATQSLQQQAPPPETQR